MSEELYSPRPLAGWYWAGAIASLLFMSLGAVVWMMHFTADPASLPLDQRAAMQAEPLWMVAANGVAVAAGLIGALLLLLRRRAAQGAMLLCLLVLLVWLAGLFLVPSVTETVSTNDIAVAIGVVAITWTILWFARHSAQRGWLR